jgi:hypothetical protein
MTGLSQYARQSRTVPVAHGEAFQIMLYRDDTGAEPEFWAWNSRDGVTPFGCKNHRHAMNAYRPTYSAVLPDEATHVFVDYDRPAWEAMQRGVYQRYLEMDGPYGGKAFTDRFPTENDWLKVNPFEHGQPRILTRDEFLAETSSWAGKFTP